MRIPMRLKLALSLTVVLSSVLVLASPTLAASPWWQLSSGSRPGHLPSQAGETGEIFLFVENLGDGGVAAASDPVQITDALPPGLEALGISATSPLPNSFGGNSRSFFPCSSSLSALSCTFSGEGEPKSPLAPYDLLEVRITVRVKQGAHSGEVNQAGVSGGGAPAASISRPLTFAGEPGEATPFGVEDFRYNLEEAGGEPVTQAGSHPFQFTTTLALNQGPDSEPLSASRPLAAPAVLAKDVYVKFPPGFVGDPTEIPTCSLAQFLTNVRGGEANACPADTAIGVASVTVAEPFNFGLIVNTQPLFNVEPYAGEPARFGFYVALSQTPVLLDASLRSGAGEGALPGQSEDYGIDVNVSNITQVAGLISARVTTWGVPGDPSHDNSRGWDCLAAVRNVGGFPPCIEPGETNPPAFLTAPTTCAAPLQASVEVDSWSRPGVFEDYLPSEPLPTLVGCNRLGFAPSLQASPTTSSASSPTGLDLNLDFHDEGLANAEGLTQSRLKDTVVTLPEGFTINPSSGVGLAGCTPVDYARESVESAPGAGCPDESKLGTVEIETPLLSQKIHGSLYIAQPHENPFNSLVALYIVAKNPETGVLIKLAGKVTPNPVTGQLVTTFENNPQLPFDRFNFHFREGQQAPLITPQTCGTYTTTAQLSPWSEPTAALTDTSSFTITSGVGGGACPSGNVPPFHPGIQSGMLNNNAGVFSPFYLHLTRTDGEQEISGFSTNLPEGLTGDLSGIPFCPEAQIALARTKTGRQEEANPSCPAASQVGHTLVGTGVGAVLAYVPGKIYLAGPFHGAPFSLVAVTSAVVGPFDLGTVVLRFGLSIDPYTAQVSVSPTSSEPIPTIIDGIVTHVRDIRVYIDRQNFTLNPTSCNPLAIGSTLNSDLGAGATITSPFQAASCANLKFAPKFAVSTSGKTSRASGASLAVKLTYPQGPAGTYANIARVKVDLPKQLPSRLTTLQKACTAAQFNANPAGCPAASFIGHAKAVTPLIPVPLEGPAIFVSHGGEAFPSLIMVLQGYGVTIDLVGSTNISKAGITSSTFKTVPDQPIGSFELTLPEGKYSALAANGNLCASKLAMPTEFLAQNGLKINESTSITVTGCAKTKTLSRAQQLAKALKACKKDKKDAERAKCVRAARKRYAPVKAKAKKAKQKKR